MENILGIVLALLASIGIAGMALCIRNGTVNGNSQHALIVVLVINLIVLIPIAAVVYYPDYGLSPRTIAAFIGAGIVGTLTGRALYYAGIERIGASRAEPIKATMPLHAAVLAVLVLGEPITLPHFFGIVLIIAGAAIISWDSARNRSVLTGNLPVFGLGITFLAAFFYGLEPIFAKYGLDQGTPFLVGLSIKTLAGTVGFLGYLTWRTGIPTYRDLMGDMTSMRWYAAAGVGNTVFLLAYYAALAIAPVVLVVPIVRVSPLIVVGVSFVFLQHLERVTWRLTTGAVIIVIGATLVTLSG